MSTHAFSQQRVLTWSIGEVGVACDGNTTTEICYPVLVSIDDASNTPGLATSTMRFFYDDNYLTVSDPADIPQNLQNSYTISGASQSLSNLGLEFGFSNGDDGVWVQFNLNASATPIDVSSTPKHIMDFCFEVTAAGDAVFNSTGFLCAPIVFDNNHSQPMDISYVTVNNEGIDGSYYLDNNTSNSFQADDEVINYLWTQNMTWSGFIDTNPSNEQIGTTDNTNCIEDVCICPEAGEDGTLTICEGETPTEAELFGALNGNPDPGGTWTGPTGGVYTYTIGGSQSEEFSFSYDDPYFPNCLGASLTASTATVNDDIAIVFNDLNNISNFFTFSYTSIDMYGVLQTSGGPVTGTPETFSFETLDPVPGGTNTYSKTINLADLYTTVPNGTAVTGFSFHFQNILSESTCELFIDLIDAEKDSNAGGGCLEDSSTVTVITESLSECAFLEWSIGTVDITCEDNKPSELCYQLMVSTNVDLSLTPQLATSSIRLFYDSDLLSQLSVPITSIENGYTVIPAPSNSGFDDPPGAGIYGDIFGFSSSTGSSVAGNWVQFEIIANTGNPIDLSTTPTHVLDLCFTSNSGNEYPLCAPIVFDNNHDGGTRLTPDGNLVGWGLGIDGDYGYLQDPDEGITGSYWINGDVSDPILADDEVINYLWTEDIDTDGTPLDPPFDGTVDAADDRTGSSDFTGCIEDECDPLPIEFLSFNAKKSGNTTVVSWVTLTELENDYYEVERSTDDVSFRSIGKVVGAGTDYSKNEYNFVDERPNSGINYYRLKQVDYEGRYSYSQIRSVYFDDAGIVLSVYPNPVRYMLEMTSEKKEGEVMLQIIDIQGQVVFEKSYQRGDWNPSQRLNISNIVEGMYMIVLKEANYSETARFVKVR
jgi:hypothetical protein